VRNITAYSPTDRDRAILRLVQQDARTTVDAIAALIGMSVSSAQRRLQRLRDEKIILAEVAVLDAKRLGQGMTFLVEIEVERDRPELLPELQRWIAKADAVQEAWYITGRGDYTLVIVAPSTDDFDAFMERLMIENRNVRKFTTNVVLKTLKRGLIVPMD
jgi:Lrp/AsnC family leucine-responsive transcriptional regulator